MIKQVIVMRRDLKMRRGKEIAQGAHASMAFLSNKLRAAVVQPLSVVEREWLEGLFTKVCLKVDSEEQLLSVAEKAKAEGLQVEVITDSGKTEFAGVPTKTCLAIGPDQAEKIDKVTGSLQLY
jgi:peptidyl-tRNA hydrolase, PTH2 family